jgi:HSP20 family protein
MFENKYTSDKKELDMVETTTKPPIKQDSKPQPWHPLEDLRREIDQLLNDFGRGYWQPIRRSLFAAGPLVRRELTWDGAGVAPPVDVLENERSYEIMAEVPGMDAGNIVVTLSDGTLTIKGEKREDREEKKRDYHLRERNFGSFERRFRVPDHVDTDKIQASFRNGVLTMILPKNHEARKSMKTVEVKAA